MTIDKAIEIQQQYRRDGEPHDLQDFEDAVDLGTEALKREVYNRKHQPFLTFGELPGETE